MLVLQLKPASPLVQRAKTLARALRRVPETSGGTIVRLRDRVQSSTYSQQCSQKLKLCKFRIEISQWKTNRHPSDRDGNSNSNKIKPSANQRSAAGASPAPAPLAPFSARFGERDRERSRFSLSSSPRRGDRERLRAFSFSLSSRRGERERERLYRHHEK